ncbi:hypothetical protein YC2023_091249 [Brassica napus]
MDETQPNLSFLYILNRKNGLIICSTKEIEEYEMPVPKENIMKRIDSHKGATFEMKDDPSELQFRALEQAQLSPRASSSSKPSPLAPVRSRGSSLGRSIPLAQELEMD